MSVFLYIDGLGSLACLEKDPWCIRPPQLFASAFYAAFESGRGNNAAREQQWSDKRIWGLENSMEISRRGREAGEKRAERPCLPLSSNRDVSISENF